MESKEFNGVEARNIPVGDGSKVHRLYHYDSLNQWLDSIDAMEAAGHNPMGTDSSRQECGYSWTLGADYPTAMRMLREGWPEGRSRVASIAEKITTVIGEKSEAKRKRCYRKAGSFVNVGRMLSGNPDCMGSRRKVIFDKQGGKIINLCINTEASCGVAGETMANFGAAAAALIEGLELAGYSVGVRSEILNVQGSTTEGVARYGQSVTIKKPEHPLDMDVLTMVLAHPATLRRASFRWIEGQDDFRSAVSSPNGYGMPKNPVCLDEEGVDMYLAGCSAETGDFTTLKGSIAWVEESLKHYGSAVDAMREDSGFFE